MKETEKKYIEAEGTSMDAAMFVKALAELRDELESLRKSIDKTDAQKREEILAIKDDAVRLKAIEQNMELFKR